MTSAHPHRSHPYRSQRIRTLVAIGLIAVLYFLVPVEPGVSGGHLVWRSALSTLVVLVVSWLIIGRVRREITGVARGEATLVRLAVALVAGIFAFALADYVIAVSYPHQFTGVTTKVDALYFALATVTTIGYGDVHAEGQFARMAVCLQMLFSVGVLATGVSLLFSQLLDRTGPGGAPPHPPGDHAPDRG
ncbi:potassium channel family protein [Micromonospora echinofusca]|uniref:Two pore domain potassium channel family protein n=1 Tax=Micromonospora echinofusca TaxID=47858 RepID=A0ABS3VMJ4_MICEH|nr:potassium channel family protein [Micromonospora echinofusca]MBO4205760.1 two pore domain potassium channel family protein [Micromonospora echinofusca]